MKPYPSISRSTGQHFREFEAYVFDKLDGSNIRVEWSRKQGWNKFGTRNRLLDQTDETFGQVIPLFNDTIASDIEKVLRDERFDKVTIFMEFWGSQSLAGQHVAEDNKFLTLFDINVYKKGILGPRKFLDLFGHLQFIPKFLGRYNWTRGFVEQVRLGQIPNITFEGVVGKAGDSHDLIMAKAKTQTWVDKIKERYLTDADKIINS